MKLDFYILKDSDNIKSFNCGDTEDHKKLNKFLIERASDHMRDYIGTTIAVYDLDSNNRVVGYITLLADSFEVEEQYKQKFFKSVVMKNKYDTFPALKIGRLAVHKDHQNKGIGKYLFKLAVAIAIESNERLGVGMRFIVVDSKEMSKDWYPGKLNFRKLVESDPYYMYYDLKGWKD